MSGSWVTDGSGTRWVEYPDKKRRKPSRAIRFADIKVGDQLMREHVRKGWRGGIDDQTKPPVELSKAVEFVVVTDLWFDPVAGQRDETAGRMAAVRAIGHDGEPTGRKWPHTLRGLASNGFRYAGDRIAECKARLDGMKEGTVVSIGRGHAIRRRPKVPGL